MCFYKSFIFSSSFRSQGLLQHFTKYLIIFLAIAKALRRETEGKASAQAEAAQWKRKYELEMARNFQLEQKGLNSVSM